MFIFPIALFPLSRTVSGIYLALGKYLFTQLMTYIFSKPVLDALYPSCLAERNCLSGNHVAGIYLPKHAAVCASRSNLILSFLNQTLLQ